MDAKTRLFDYIHSTYAIALEDEDLQLIEGFFAEDKDFSASKNKPYKLIADYPGNTIPVGSVLHFSLKTSYGRKYTTGEPQQWVRDPHKYPHLFQKID